MAPGLDRALIGRVLKFKSKTANNQDCKQKLHQCEILVGFVSSKIFQLKGTAKELLFNRRKIYISINDF